MRPDSRVFRSPAASRSPFRDRWRGGWLRLPQSGDEPTFGLASDVAANVFVVLFMAVLIGLVARPAPSEPVDYDLKGALRLTERRPNAALDLVNVLHRRQSGRGIALDLFADRLRLSAASVERSWRWTDIEPIRRALQSLGSGTVDLFVFDPRGYAIVMDTLEGRSITEISVPIALRSCAGTADCAGRVDWSEGFQSLVGRDMADPAFRAALADLLAAQPQPAPPNRSTLSNAVTARPIEPPPSAPWNYLLPGPAYGLIIILVLVFLIESLGRRMGGREIS